jgi:hypothetical protein
VEAIESRDRRESHAKRLECLVEAMFAPKDGQRQEGLRSAHVTFDPFTSQDAFGFGEGRKGDGERLESLMSRWLGS